VIHQLNKRFAELAAQVDEIAALERTKHSEYADPYQHIEPDLLLGWCVKARNLIVSACGKDSEHLKTFIDAEKLGLYENNPAVMKRVRAVFLAAKEDFEGGYLTSLRNLVEAEVFSSELDQATELLAAGYRGPAAVICGVVLETNLRNICAARGIPTAKLDKMNAALAKAGVYNSLVQKRITALAAIRNSAAHGNETEFRTADVGAMIQEVERLVSEWLS